MKFIGDIFVDFKDFKAAEKTFSTLKSMCEENGMYTEKLVLYNQCCYLKKLTGDY
jgi:hypothetical protein